MDNKDNKIDNDLLRKLVKYTSIPFEFFILIGGGAWFGSWLDKKIQVKFPWFMLGFAIFGLVIGLYHVYKSLKNDNLQ